VAALTMRSRPMTQRAIPGARWPRCQPLDTGSRRSSAAAVCTSAMAAPGRAVGALPTCSRFFPRLPRPVWRRSPRAASSSSLRLRRARLLHTVGQTRLGRRRRGGEMGADRRTASELLGERTKRKPSDSSSGRGPKSLASLTSLCSRRRGVLADRFRRCRRRAETQCGCLPDATRPGGRGA